MELKYAELAISKIPHTPNDRIVKAVFFLFLLQGQQPFPENRYKRQGALAGFGFCAIGFYKNFFSIQPNRCDCVADFNSVLLKVYSSPFQPYLRSITR